MACTVYKTRRTTRRDVISTLGENPFTRSDEAFLNEVVTEVDERVFMCGGEAQPICCCGHLADLLCDYPMGRGKTCDLPLCPDCAHRIGDDRDLCGIHFAEFSGKAEPARVFGKGPRLVK